MTGKASTTEQPTVVYIEDDDLHVKLVSDCLAGRCRLLHAADGLSGLALVERIRPALVLVDLRLPGLSGFEVIEKLQANPATSRVPVVVLSARNMAGETARAEKLGCRAFVVKPFHLHTLRKEVDAILTEG